MLTRAAGEGWYLQGGQLEHLADFFYRSAWLSTAERPETGSSYTNNRPYDPDAGDARAAGAFSARSGTSRL